MIFHNNIELGETGGGIQCHHLKKENQQKQVKMVKKSRRFPRDSQRVLPVTSGHRSTNSRHYSISVPEDASGIGREIIAPQNRKSRALFRNLY